MILAKSELRKAIERRELQFLGDDGAVLPEWFHVSMGQVDEDPVALQPASVDLTLGDHWLVPKSNMLVHTDGWGNVYKGTRVCDSMDRVEYEESHDPTFLIPAHGFVLARTKETVSLSPALFGKVEGRSSVGRLGLVVETAGVIDPGFRGTITLEIANLLPYPVLLHAGTRICQIVVFRMDGDTEGGYAAKGKYMDQVQATGSKLYKDFQK
jgi:dCTP deaminase